MSKLKKIPVHGRPCAGDGAGDARADAKASLGIAYGPDTGYAPAEVFVQERVVEVDAIATRVMPRRASVGVLRNVQGIRWFQRAVTT